MHGAGRQAGGMRVFVQQPFREEQSIFGMADVATVNDFLQALRQSGRLKGIEQAS